MRRLGLEGGVGDWEWCRTLLETKVPLSAEGQAESQKEAAMDPTTKLLISIYECFKADD